MNVWIKPSKTVLEMPENISQNSLSQLIIRWIYNKIFVPFL